MKKNLNNHIIKQVTQNHDAAVHSTRCHPPKRYFTTKSVFLWGRTLAFSTAHKSQSSPHPAKGASSAEFSDASRTSLLFRSSVAATSQGKSGPPNSSAQNPAEVALLGLREATTRNNFFPSPHESKAVPSAAAQGTCPGLTAFAQQRACLPRKSEVTLSSSRARLQSQLEIYPQPACLA